jgi:hypothetical protein
MLEVAMLRFSSLSAGAIAAFAALAGPALAEAVPSPDAAAAVSSRAAVVNLNFVVNGQKTSPGAEVLAAGMAPPAYNKKTVRATYARTTHILGGLVFTRSATAVQSIAAGTTSTATGGIASAASASVGSFKGTLSGPIGNLITATTGKVLAKARFTRTKTGVASVQGSTSLLSFTVSAPAIGLKKTFSGTPKPNQVLYSNGDKSIIIYLNRQIITKVAGKPVAIAVDAVDVQITNFNLLGNTISGRIEVCPTYARG